MHPIGSVISEGQWEGVYGLWRLADMSEDNELIGRSDSEAGTQSMGSEKAVRTTVTLQCGRREAGIELEEMSRVHSTQLLSKAWVSSSEFPCHPPSTHF